MITLRQFEAGEIIIEENAIGETAYIIEQGRVGVTKERDGHAVHIKTFPFLIGRKSSYLGSIVNGRLIGGKGGARQVPFFSRAQREPSS